MACSVTAKTSGGEKSFGRQLLLRNRDYASNRPSSALWDYSAISRFSANGHLSSIHCAWQRKPVANASCRISWREYLWLLSVQIVSPSSNETLRSAAGMLTVCLRVD